ncbi:MAG: hypothetical protein RBS45_09475 [Anaerolineales bacterium]|jgi:hypothetical protein|nr:hypothetical protein [Anaerolineales bacterium]GER80418.1 conserved hypothetical protein [Candidatus Denitrolinea symbiosum]
MSRFWPHFFLLAFIEGLAALAALFLIPAESLSLARLALVGAILFPLAASGWMFVRSLDGDWRARALDPTAYPRIFRALAISSPLLFLTFGLILFLLRYLDPAATASYYERARPALTYLLLLAAQTSLWLAALRNGIHLKSMWTRRAVFVGAGIVLAVFLAVWLLIALTGLGITEDPSYWSEPGVPILGWQLLLALLLSALCLLPSAFRSLPSAFRPLPSAFRSLPSASRPLPSASRLLPSASRPLPSASRPLPSASRPLPSAFRLLPSALYLLALVLWLSVPLTSLRNSFYAPITPPYLQPFPASDAAYYDTSAQSLLMGFGFVQHIPTRPLFIVFLAALHALLGQDYARLIFGQTLLLALFPVALYFLGKRLHSRAAGVTVALLASLREWNSLLVASDVRVSNTKMLLSDFVTTLALTAFLLLVLRWFRERRDGSLLAFVSGGALGLLLLLRTQSAFLAPGVLLLAFPIFWPKWKTWFAQSALFAAGLVLAVSPWLARNYFVAGQLSLDDPTQVKNVASMYGGGTPSSNLDQFAGQSPEEASRFVVDTILHRPAYVAGFVTNQFLANSIDTLLVLPIFARYDGLSAPIHPYWYEWDGHPSTANVILFLVYLAVISLGIAAAWKRLRWAGLLPLVFFICYALSTSLARYSGWRYIFPADWVGYFYFALGAAEFFSLAALVFGASGDADRHTGTQVDPSPAARHPSLVFFLLSSFIFLFLGSLPWLTESIIPRTTLPCADSVPACLAAAGVDEARAARFLGQPDALALSGRVLYPRYFSRGNGLASTNPNPAYAPRDFPRMGFYLLAPDGVTQTVLPMKGARPFPNAADALLLGCQRGDYVEARLVFFPATGEAFENGPLDAPCPNP